MKSTVFVRLTKPTRKSVYRANDAHDPSIVGRGRFRILRIGSMMSSLRQYAMQRSPSDNRDPDDIRERLRRATAKSGCELCESRRYTDVKCGMEVCHPCRLESLPVTDRRSI